MLRSLPFVAVPAALAVAGLQVPCGVLRGRFARCLAARRRGRVRQDTAGDWRSYIAAVLAGLGLHVLALRIGWFAGAGSLLAHAAGSRLRLVGITGSLGAGKSTVRQRLQEAVPDAVVLDVDATTRRLLSPGNLIYRSLVRSFGARAVLQKGSRQIDRSRLTEYLRANEEKRARFNRIMTRYLSLEIGVFCRHGLFRPLLIDISWESLRQLPVLQFLMDPLVVVEADAETVMQRLVARSGADPVRVRSLLEPRLKETVSLRTVRAADGGYAGERLRYDNGPVPTPGATAAVAKAILL